MEEMQCLDTAAPSIGVQTPAEQERCPEADLETALSLSAVVRRSVYSAASKANMGQGLAATCCYPVAGCGSVSSIAFVVRSS
eukprot:5964271-Karenia_brevis.AAC.1